MPDSLTQLLFHIVFTTKHRHPWIDPELRGELKQFTSGVVRRIGGGLIVLGGVPDHVHLLVRLKPQIAVASMVRGIKANSSRWIRQLRPELDFRWQRNYAAFSVSPSGVERLTRYIDRQEEHHRKWGFEREMEVLLRRHGVPVPRSVSGGLAWPSD